jgi:hypothetical protein
MWLIGNSDTETPRCPQPATILAFVNHPAGPIYGEIENAGACPMRQIHLTDGTRVRFPGRTEEFDQGVEIGILAVLMDFGTPEITRPIASTNLEQARALADKLGYRLLEGVSADGLTTVILRRAQTRPALKLVHSA